jgi:hypothetical protein
MLKWLMKRKLRAFGDAFGYDISYGLELIDVDVAAGLALARLSKVAAYRADAPAAAWHAAKIVAAMSEDCGLASSSASPWRNAAACRSPTCARSLPATSRG